MSLLVHASNPFTFRAVRKKTKTNGIEKVGGGGVAAPLHQRRYSASIGTEACLCWYRGPSLLVQRCFLCKLLAWIREYRMIYRGPGRLAVVWVGSSPTPFSPLLVACCHSFYLWVPCRESNSGLPYSNPTRCCMSHAAPCLSYAAPLSEPRRTLTCATPHPQPSASSLSYSVFCCVPLVELTDGRRRGGRSQIISRRESPVLYKSFILSGLAEISKQINFIRIVFPGYTLPFAGFRPNAQRR